jgi:hypothetical protein
MVMHSKLIMEARTLEEPYIVNYIEDFVEYL